jgi:hypothetical protein
LYGEKESPRYERAAMRWLRCYLDEKSPTLTEFAKSCGFSRSDSKGGLRLS